MGKVSGDDLINLYGKKLIKSYTALKIKFKFPDTVKYPNLPVRLDLNSVIFPLEGETFCTGIEFYLAMELKCQIEILGGVYIPFKPSKNQQEEKKTVQGERKEKEIFIKDPKINQLEDQIENQIRNLVTKKVFEEHHQQQQQQQQQEHQEEEQRVDGNPKVLFTSDENGVVESNFYSTVKELLVERLKYPKGSYMNLLYKFLANAGIGQMARGLNQKVRYDSQSNSTKILPSGDLVSPLFAG